MSGPAICLGCKAEWMAVAPVGIYQLQCPTCLGWKGIFKNPLQSDLPTFECKCGCHLFYITQPFRLNCWNCGNVPNVNDL